VGTFFHELLRVGLYKRSQGRITRQVTFAALVVTIALGCLRMSSLMSSSTVAASAAESLGAHPWLSPFYYIAVACAWFAARTGFYLWFPTLVLAAMAWGSYRLVNLPGFADFLIAVEAEMNKVSWPTRTELFRASMVVLIMIFSLAIILFVYDSAWFVLLTKVLHIL
jgi:preprotein translocase subunit SecE